MFQNDEGMFEIIGKGVDVSNCSVQQYISWQDILPEPDTGYLKMQIISMEGSYLFSPDKETVPASMNP